jgi:hypothetical protein
MEKVISVDLRSGARWYACGAQLRLSGAHVPSSNTNIIMGVFFDAIVAGLGSHTNIGRLPLLQVNESYLLGLSYMTSLLCRGILL